MKWLFGLLLPVILLIGCSSQSGQKEPAEEVSGEMNEQQVELAVNPVQTDQQIEFQMSLKNKSGSPIDFTFSSGQKFELTVHDQHNKELYRYSKDRMFTQAFQTVTLMPNETYDFSDVWKNVPGPGTYTVTVTFLGKSDQIGKRLKTVKTFEVK
ncbi:BsuPI-related putative proteinase inhibitor [Bacillus sp. L381]|uniref:Proteinase inhibitor n=1 Tax=Bacillus amyloliquefaciens TaxID=1390 RepID=A0AAP7TD27_BACAM|nr:MULTISPECIES: BsuPI-related putative proteinase inhibitor [Bacillus]AOC90539.1 Intracellular proteinase inhibitor [Bacillus amyloliquefaciens]MCR9037658.1 BsuPI-related putative proteinase inhibitor [Bacillus velezensis]MCZ4246763.1 BsuPI-related putative proteinase inhibitor [Bacillus amyloliquefaciens]MDH3089572.1 BsuPI-related putative proteinase inhibitor [Bacillus amyloliquefaciens]MEC3840601.1 BsuPI-related putative proteinase inhibitor [Bacillus amyloliquefaciens]